MPRERRPAGGQGGRGEADKATRMRGVRDAVEQALLGAHPGGPVLSATVQQLVDEVARIYNAVGEHLYLGGEFGNLIPRHQLDIRHLMACISDTPNANTKIRKVSDYVFRGYHDNLHRLETRIRSVRAACYAVMELVLIADHGDNVRGEITWGALNGHLAGLLENAARAAAPMALG